MNKIIFFIFVCISLQASLVNSVVASVDNEAITLFDVSEVGDYKLSYTQKIDFIIQQKIEKKLFNKFSISIDDNEIDNYIKYMASSQHMSESQYINKLTNNGMKLSVIYEDFRKQLSQKKLYQQIVQMNHNIQEQDIKEYYNNNKNLFTMPSKVAVRVYTSTAKNELEQQKQNLMFVNPNIKISDSVIEKDTSNVKLFEFLLNTPNKTFTPIIKLQENWTMFYVTNKYGKTNIEYDKIKNMIMQKMIENRKNQILNDFFQNYKKTLNIKRINTI